MSQISIYIKSLEGRSIKINVGLNETIGEGKRKYKVATNSSNADPQWKFDGVVLQNNKTFDYYGIEDDDNITSNDRSQGGGGMKFTDVSKKHTINIGFSSDAPDYRTVDRGINIFGICKTANCVTQKNEVIVPINKNKLDLINEKFNFNCPECNAIIEPKTVGFYLCKYHIYGSKIKDGKVVNFDNGIQEANDSEHLQYFDEASNDTIFFIQLIIEIINYY